jgi:hypothetical protein
MNYTLSQTVMSTILMTAMMQAMTTVSSLKARVIQTKNVFSRCLHDYTYILTAYVMKLGPILAYFNSFITYKGILCIRYHDFCLNYAIIKPGGVVNVNVPSKPRGQSLLCTLRKKPCRKF